MSDTDDTDLLLLIPPDFFLVRSPDLGFDSDSDIDITFDHEEVKNSLVSDLIDHVNDLESRICFIESFDRPHTQCSTCNGNGSIVNQSVNSLTESDILRTNNKKSELLLDIISNNTTSPQLPTLYAYNLESCSTGLKIPVVEDIPEFYLDSQVSPMVKQQETDTANLSYYPVDLQSVHGKSHKDVLSEVDSYLKSKKSKGVLVSEVNYCASKCENNEPICKNTSSTISAALKSVENGNLGNNYLKKSFTVDNHESVALPQVYNLLREMEQTQHDMERKLKPKESYKDSLSYQDTRSLNDLYKSDTNRLHNFKSAQPTPLNKSGIVLDERCGSSSNDKDKIQDRHYMLPTCNTQVPTSIYIEAKNSEQFINLNQDELKVGSTSPRKSSFGRSPVDIVRGNSCLSRKEGEVDFTNSPFDKDRSPRKNINFRKHLSFDSYNVPLIKSKTSSLDSKMRLEPLTEMQQKNGDMVDFARCLSEKRSSHSLDDKTYAISHRMGEKPKYHDAKLPDGIHILEALEKKISSSNLLSLSELWNKEPTFYSDDPSKLRQKLEEEKYRRQHCEQQIQQLQQRVLEQQERLAVAVRVDQEKDRAIAQITQSWRRLNEHWNELEEQRHGLAEQLQSEKESAKTKSQELDKKVERWEKEVSQALDLAAGYKEKCELAQKQKDLLMEESNKKIEEANGDLQTLTDEINKTTCENKNLTNDLEMVREKLKEEEELLTKLKDELEKTQQRTEALEAEINVLKEQKDSLITKIRDEKNRRSILEQQKNSFQEALNEAAKKEKAALEEARVGGERLEVARTELRALYQGQLEAVVREKLQEFQTQLESAEEALRAELKVKEKQWAEKASDQCRHWQDKHRLEMLRLEEAHREEMNKWKERLMESERLRTVSESRLQGETNRRADIAQRLHNVMETQWREALNIISNPLQNVYEVPKEDNDDKWASSQNRSNGDSRRVGMSSGSTNEEAPFFREGLVTSRPSQQPADHKLKKYIQILLERGPGHPILNDSLQDSFDVIDDDRDLGNRWLHDEVQKDNNQNDRYSEPGKPPWK